MQEELKELLASLETASRQAKALAGRGVPVERVYRALDLPIREVRNRLAYIEDVADKEAQAAKAEAEAGKASLTADAIVGAATAKLHESIAPGLAKVGENGAAIAAETERPARSASPTK